MAKWGFVTPVMKQSFVTTGVSLNMAGMSYVMAFSAGLLPQLKEPDSEIPIDDSIGSWIAATPGISLLLGIILTPFLMSWFGGRISYIIIIIWTILGWLCIALANNVIFIILGRFIQGIALGVSVIIGPILIAEYASPKHRGLFLMYMSTLAAFYVLVGHIFGYIFSWRTTALIFMTLSIANLPVMIYSPESPIWLAHKARYEDCKVAFRWLRGDEDEEELKALIRSTMVANNAKADKAVDESFGKKISEIKVIIKKKEFYKPIILMFHLYTLYHWAGGNLISAYTSEIFENVLGKDANITMHVAVLDAQRVISNILSMYIVKQIKRRTMLISITGVNIFALLAVAAYVYVRSVNIFESAILGFILVHIHMFAIASCSLPLPLMLAGEIFPLKYKSTASGISNISFAFNMSLVLKTVPFLFSTLGMYGAYCLYALVVSYCLLIAYLYLPETKDRTLLEIERDFTGEDKPLTIDELKSAESLMS